MLFLEVLQSRDGFSNIMTMDKYIISIDIGGTGIKMGIFRSDAGESSKDATLTKKWAIPTDISDNGSHIINDIVTSVNEMLTGEGIAKADILAAGVGVPGAVTDGVVNKCVSLNWGIVNVKEEFSKRLWGIPVAVGNDANTAALGEMWKGSGKGVKNLVLLTIGTDIGGGVIIDGKPVAGAFGGGGEIGHIPFDTDEAVPHPCGKCGCFGQYASGTGLALLARRSLTANKRESTLRDKSLSEITAKDVIDRARNGDELALEIFKDYGRRFGRGLAMVSCVLEPELFILGGGVSQAGDFLLDVIRDSFKDYAFHTAIPTRIITASLKSDAGIYGAAYMALELMENQII